MTCPICEGIDPDLSNVANAAALGTSEASIRRHKAANHTSDPNPTGVLVGATVRDPNTGSWYRYKYAHQGLDLSTDDLEAALASYAPATPPQTPLGGTLVVCGSDFQIGKTDRLGGTTQTIHRVLASFSRVADKIKTQRPAEVVLADPGDILEGFGNTTQQRQTNDLNITSQIRVARRLMLEGIKMFAPLVPKLTVVSVPSNHCQVRIGVGNKNVASTPDDDYGIEVLEQLRDVCANSDALRHVAFVRPGKFDESVVHETSGTRVGFVHGHQTKSPDKIGSWWQGQSHGRGPVGEADILVVGHWHSLRVQQSGDARTVFVCPTSDNGSSWFTNGTGESSDPGILTFRVDDGRWDAFEVL